METIQHVAIIADGNRRWAKQQGMEKVKGHMYGMNRIDELAKLLIQKSIPYFSLYAWSTENWNRTKYEQNYIFKVFYNYLVEKKEELKKEGIKLCHFGRADRLPKKVIEKLYEVIDYTKDCMKLQMNLCLDYGGRDEIVRTVQKVMQSKADIRSEKDFEKYLDTSHVPDVDIMIRTSGEQRLSNFLLWQNAYAEFFFVPEYFPDFTDTKLEGVLAEYKERERRKGK